MIIILTWTKFSIYFISMHSDNAFFKYNKQQSTPPQKKEKKKGEKKNKWTKIGMANIKNLTYFLDKKRGNIVDASYMVSFQCILSIKTLNKHCYFILSLL